MRVSHGIRRSTRTLLYLSEKRRPDHLSAHRYTTCFPDRQSQISILCIPLRQAPDPPPTTRQWPPRHPSPLARLHTICLSPTPLVQNVAVSI